MANHEQKDLWRKEKEQMLRDKDAQSREVRRRGVYLQLAAGGKPSPIKPNKKNDVSLSPEIPDDILRKRLGI